ncbi:hypothetical protein DL546_002258 [Coniochaeta pulveracea]|uniref:NmrA-like domain-containing protein n=1 Tax=Coniochaeta pulveracea TaxID=177199 RepID=A0A420Y6H0_9PEZI|nr:hypothetical protein DL546_002258 [Coniochaeta pulveracea]
MAARKLLIVGATGQQGRATIAALYAATSNSKDHDLHIFALTRSISSPSALSLLQEYPKIALVQGDTRNPGPIFQDHPDIAAVFLVTVPRDEEAQAVPLIDAALASGRAVDHIVFSSVDRGGNDTSWDNPTPVPHFAAKHRIELHLRDACERADRRMRWTILRPTGFMDNYQPGTFGSMMAALWRSGLPADRKTQLVNTHDIGVFAARALLDPEQYAGRAVGLAGDDLTFGEGREIFKRVLGKEMPVAWGIVAKGVLWFVEEARASFEWFDRVGYGVDIPALRQEEPRLQTFEMWLRESSRWKDEIASHR